MELSNNRPPDPERSLAEARRAGAESVDRAGEARDGALRDAMERLSRTREAQAAHLRDLARADEERRAALRDRLDLSDTARRFASVAIAGGTEEDRAELVRSLKNAYENGDLATRERIVRAAERLLADS